MAARLSIPTKARLPETLLVSTSNTAVIKIIRRLSRPSLLRLALDWLADSNQTICPPLLRSEEEDEAEDDSLGDLHPPVASLEELREIYEQMQLAKGSRREVFDRVLDGDWRRGLSLYQLAMADLQYFYDHPASLKWGTFQIQPLKAPADEAEAENEDALKRPDRESLVVPRFHPPTFLRNLQSEVLPDVKAHYTFDRHRTLPASLLRIWVIDSPYNTSLAVPTAKNNNRASVLSARGPAESATFDASRTIYIVFPDAAPHLYISISASSGPLVPGEARSLRSLMIDGVPKALSRPRERYALKRTSVATRNLEALMAVKGAGRSNAARGGWGVYAEEARHRKEGTDSPLNLMLPTPPLSDAEPSGGRAAGVAEQESRERKRKRMMEPEEERREKERRRAKVVARGRFGGSGKVNDGQGVERVDIQMEDAFPDAPPRALLNDRADEAEEDDDGGDLAAGRRRKSNKGRRSGLELEFEQLKTHDDSMAMDDGGDDGGGDGEDAEGAWRPVVRLTFHGPHVFAGIRQLVEGGVVDGERMPGWMTGEEGVTIGTVRHGRIKGFKGSGV